MIKSSMYKKIIITLLLVVFIGHKLMFPSVASAQKWWAPTHNEFNEKINSANVPANEIFGERYTHAQVWWVVYSLINLAFGTSTMQCAADASSAETPETGAGIYADCLSQNGYNPPRMSSTNNTTPLANAKAGDWGILAIGALSDQMLSNKPASGVKYISGLAQRVRGVFDANAQQPLGGFGFNSLQPLQSIWAVSRNAAYALMTLAIVLLAFMIMFRTKISPQASVTVQNAIPRIVIGLILITFSFAIAGLIIDLAYVLQGMITALVSSSSLVGANDPIYLFNRMNDVTTGVVSYGLFAILVVIANSAAWFIPTLGVSLVVGALLVVVILIVLVLVFIRLFWLLLRTYVMIIFHIIALPFAALGYVVSPGSNYFMQLLRSLIGHISVFVTVSVVVMFAHLIAWNMTSPNLAFLGGGNNALQPFTNPYFASVGNVQGTLGLPAFAGVDSSNLALLVGLVILLMAPSIAGNIRSLITSGRGGQMDVVGAGAASMVGGLIGGAVGSGVKEAVRPHVTTYTERVGGAIARTFRGGPMSTPPSSTTGQTGSQSRRGGP